MVKLKRVLSMLLIGCLLFSLAACGGSDADTESGGQSRDYPVTIGDVTIRKAPKSVAVLSACLADVIIACGYEVLVGARSADCGQAAVALKTDVGDPYAPNVEAIIEEDVDLVLGDALPSAEVQSALEKAKIQFVLIEPAVSRADFERLYTEVCSALNGGKTGYEQGVRISDSIFLSIDGIGRVIPNNEVPPTACYVYNEEGEVATGDTLAGVLLEMAGALNVAAGNTDHMMDGSEIAMANPYYIFCAEGVKDSIVNGSRYADLLAVQEGRVYEIPAHFMIWQGKTVVETVQTLAEIMFPEMNGSSAPEEKASSKDDGQQSEPEESSQSSAATSDSASSKSASYETLREGDEGADVKALQERLKALGYLFGTPDGKYGTGTVNAVSNFQLKIGITADGVAGAKTQERLFADDAPKA